MNWYKKAQLNNTSNLIAGWIRSAIDQDLYVPDLMSNIEAIDGGLVTPEDTTNAINQASYQVTSEQGGELTLHQQKLVSTLMQNVSPTENDNSMDMSAPVEGEEPMPVMPMEMG